MPEAHTSIALLFLREPIGVACIRRFGVIQVYKDADLSGAGDLLSRSNLARGIPKCLYSRLSVQTLRDGRFEEQRADSLKAKERHR